MHLPRFQWLETYTFQYELKFLNLEYAQTVYNQAVRHHLSNGTTTCSYFATIHLEACKVLVDIVEEADQRGYIGKVNKDRNSPIPLLEDTQKSIDDTNEFVQYVHSKGNKMLTPVITPRFVASCLSELMQELAKISRMYTPKLPIQSHLAENQEESKWVETLHPESETYAEQDERDLLRDNHTAVIHCPTSNFSLSSGVLNVRRLLREGVKVGLGTDVSAGYSPPMLDAICQVIIASKLVSIGSGSLGEQVKEEQALSYAEAFHLATMGSAEALGLGDNIGNFVVGKD
ncbi:hypothetical protein PsorP6_013278 [Peronosclerospora sorghi]|uniref:Uncharacterized protein n=1 Tax=Peronosclerospora sorghi TaxID=230839 RepID=A0ACC0WHU3_9STRA|nr:hypothetical protein PsorP6_013278 [Peronosclerospora sorghi]